MDSSDVELPPLPVTIKPSLSRLPIGRVMSRKRPFAVSTTTTIVDDDDLAAAFNTSSDPAVFSSEETPDLENYSGSKRRKKKVYSGTWWGRLRSSEKLPADKHGLKGKRHFKRNFDSGIFMGDESSSGPDFSSDPVDLPRTSTKDDQPSDLGSSVDTDSFEQRVPAARKEGFRRAPSRITVEKSVSDLRVEKVVQHCLEDCVADIDLTNMQLESLPSTIVDLNTLVKPGSEASYSRLRPHLRLYLGNNSFEMFPSAIPELTQLRLLSIRQNHLKEIPGAIRTLRKLEELNISGNKLEYLPFEVLEMLDSTSRPKLLLNPNPWAPLPSTRELLPDSSSLYLERNVRNLRLSRIAIQRATVFGPIGVATLTTESRRSETNRSRSPFLTELVLRKLLRTNESAKTLLSLYSDLLSDNVKVMLETLNQCQSGNGKGRQCTFCHKDMIQPRLRWLEWWYVQQVDGWEDVPAYIREDKPTVLDTDRTTPLPFLREACGCVSQVEGLEEETKTLKHRIPQPLVAISKEAI